MQRVQEANWEIFHFQMVEAIHAISEKLNYTIGAEKSENLPVNFFKCQVNIWVFQNDAR